jgi:hypothetical protein
MPVLALLVLAPVCAEYLSAYDETTGDPIALLSGLLFLAPLYGCPALLIREWARRARLGWPGVLLAALAFGIVEAGVVDQSLFISHYRDIRVWPDLREPTLIAPLGISGYLTLLFLYGHVIWSIGAPIAIVEALWPARAQERWMGRRGVTLAATGYVVASAAVLADTLHSERTHASWAQVAVCLLAVAALLWGATALANRRPRRSAATAPRPRTVFASAFAAGLGFQLVPPTWPGVALAATLVAGAFVGIRRRSRAAGWDGRHVLALAASAVLADALLAFVTSPVVGDVPDGRKYTHNAVLLLVICALLALAWNARDTPRPTRAASGSVTR